MDALYNSIAASCAVVLVVWAWRVLNWVFLRPKKLEKYLRRQGLKGNSYRLLYGDLQEMSLMIKEAYSTPISLSSDIVPRVIPFILKSVEKNGKNSFIWIGPTPMVLIMEPELIKEVLSKHYNFQRPNANPLTKLLATGVANYEGEKWAKHRKLINPAFHLEKLKHMLPAFYSSCSEMMSKWEKKVSTEGTCELDVWPDLETLTGDVISRTAFGSSYNEGRRIFKLQNAQAELAVQAIQSIYIPGWRFLPTKRNKRMKKIDKDIQALLRKIINRRLNAMTAGEASNSDLLGILLETNMNEVQLHGNMNDGMSIEEVIEECKLFYFAGHQTTAVLLVWTLVLLSKHPNWQARAREEVLEVFGNDKPNFDGLNRLKIVTMIFSEVLRLYPPLALLTRTVHKETKLREICLPAGVQLSLPIMLLHHDHEIWRNDAKDFIPERFSEGVSKATKSQVSYFPFSWGPRICLGHNYAMLEAKMVLAMIVQRFSFKLSASYVHAPYLVITVQPQYGVNLILQKL